MKRFLLPLFALLLVPATAFGQWTSKGGFPSNDSELLWTHGIATDPDGKVWIQPFGGPRAEIIRGTGADADTLAARQLLVYNADGTEWEKSPIIFLDDADGARVDTLGGFTNAEGAWEQRSGRGMATGADGHILVSQWNTLYKLNYMTGALVAHRDFTADMGDPRALTAAAATESSVFVTGVWPGNAVWELDPMDLSVKSTAIEADDRHGFSRVFAVSPDGNRIFWAGYTLRGVIEYARSDEFSAFDSLGVVIPGVSAESFAYDPAGHLWVGSGSDDAFSTVNAYVGEDSSTVFTSWSVQSHYAFHPDSLEADKMPKALDRITWDLTVGGDAEDGLGRPRGIAFAPDGNTAYVTQFNQGAPSTQAFMRDKQDEDPVASHWMSAAGFPSNDSELLWTHGIATDPDGKVWIQPFGGPRAEIIRGTGADADTLAARQLLVYNADGTEWEKSPIIFLDDADGARVDTLGGFTNAEGAWEQRSGRGMATGADGHILVSQWNTLYKLNYMTGALVAHRDFTADMGDPRALTAAAATESSVFVTGVWPGNAVWELDPMDLSVKSTAIEADDRHGFSRVFAVSPDGNRIFWAGYTLRGVIEYARSDEFSAFDSLGVVIPGVSAESFAYDPAGHLWVGSGSDDAFSTVNAYPGGNITFWSVQSHYAFNIAHLKADRMPKALDRITWDLTVGGDAETGAGRPRGIAFSPDGMKVYVTQFNQGAPSTQVLTRGGVVSVEDEPFEIPEQFVLHQNYPNPFNPSTTIEYEIMEATAVTVRVYDTLGRLVTTLVNGTMQQPGSYRVQWDGTSSGVQVASGMYFYALETPDFRQVRQMVLVK